MDTYTYDIQDFVVADYIKSSMTKVWLNILREGNTALCGWSGLWLDVEIWCSSSALFVQLLTDDKATVLRNAYKETKIRKNEVNRPWRVHALDSNGKHSVIAARWDVTFYLFSSSEWVLPQLVASNRDSIHISLHPVQRKKQSCTCLYEEFIDLISFSQNLIWRSIIWIFSHLLPTAAFRPFQKHDLFFILKHR